MAQSAEGTGDGEPGGVIRVMAVDDHPIFRDGLASLLTFYSDMELVTEASNGAEAIEQHRIFRPDVTLMDLSMPGVGGVAAIKAIVSENPNARIIALTTYDGDSDIHRALEAGARGYLLKDALRNHVAAAIRAVHRGERVIPPAVAGKLAAFTPRVELTERELEVLSLLARGMTNKEIAGTIGRTEATVKVHVLHILQKLGVDDRTGAVAVALKRGIIHLA